MSQPTSLRSVANAKWKNERIRVSAADALQTCIDKLEAPRDYNGLLVYADCLKYCYERLLTRNKYDHIFCMVDLENYAVNVQIINTLPRARVMVTRTLVFPNQTETVIEKTFGDLLKEIIPEIKNQTHTAVSKFKLHCATIGIDTTKYCIENASQIVREYDRLYTGERRGTSQSFARKKRSKCVSEIKSYGYPYGDKSAICLLCRYHIADDDQNTVKHNRFMTGLKKWIAEGCPIGGGNRSGKCNAGLTKYLYESGFFISDSGTPGD